ncbi:hypothetical protein BR93DRAFT_56311 [Coniochaeta sp. PMI_546]|nr:hypothetical protein BR93DRAFT_56311 [Coniochaeta sp. PMI_546]
MSFAFLFSNPEPLSLLSGSWSTMISSLAHLATDRDCHNPQPGQKRYVYSFAFQMYSIPYNLYLLRSPAVYLQGLSILPDSTLPATARQFVHASIKQYTPKVLIPDSQYE